MTAKKYSNTVQILTPDADVVLAALFVKAPVGAYTVAVNATEGGTASGSGACTSGQTANLFATADSGWHFVGWFEGETKLSGSANFSYTVTKNVALTAKFEKDAEQKPPKVIIRNFTASSRTYDYRSSIEFAATVDNPIFGGQIRWYVDDEYVRTGDTCTAENVKQSFSLQAKYYADGKEIPEAATEVEKVNVNAGFFARLKAFVRVLFRKLPVVVQEYLGAEIIDRILP